MNRLSVALSAFIVCIGINATAHAGLSGKQVVAAKGCAACHGNKGQGQPQAGYPRLADQSAAYLESQLHAFASGDRPNVVMQAQARGLTDEEMHAAAQYFASLDAPALSAPQADSKLLDQGRRIVVNGLWEKNVPACQSCHAPGARGFPPFPSLAGQGATYMETQLRDWQTGSRPEGPDGLMAHVAKQLDSDEVHAVAEYLASLPPTGPLPPGTQRDVAPAVPDAMPGFFQPPLANDVPKGRFGESVKRGFLIFTRTPRYAGEYIGNSQSCSNCHTNAGRQANSAPMWAAWGMYPAYRGKNKKVNDMVMRLQGCFAYSENAQASSAGGPPPADSPVMIDVESYMYWMSTGVPTGKKMAGRGYGQIAEPAKTFSRERGKQVFAANCALCHGDDGQGRRRADGSYAFPPLWGAKSYNWGAGMHAVDKAAAFIKHNMPLGYPGKLGLQDTWDVSAWINSHPRPQDPRFKGNLDETVRQFHHNRKMDFYGKQIEGRVLGAAGTLESWEKSTKAGD